jgi:outer membrane protein assembly factor BamB
MLAIGPATTPTTTDPGDNAGARRRGGAGPWARRVLAIGLSVAIGAVGPACSPGGDGGRERGGAGGEAEAGETTTTSAPSPYGPGWSAVHADSGNTDYSPVEGAADVTLAWQRDLGGGINLGATFDAAGRAYVTTAAPGCHLYVLDVATGDTVWCSDEVDRFAVASSPLLDHEGRAFLADGEAMHAFDADGEVLWETPTVGVPLSAQFSPEGRVVFVTHIGRVYLLDRTTGAPVIPDIELIPGATFDPAENMRGCPLGLAACPSANTPAVDHTTGRMYFTFWEPGAPQGGLQAMQITEGDRPAITPLWTNDALPGGSASSPDVSPDGSRLYVNDNAGNMHALDAATGEEIWSIPIGYASSGSASTSPEGLILPTGGQTSPLSALRDDGDRATEAWRIDTMVNRGIATQAAGGKAYATAAAEPGHNDLVVIDTADGTELDREPVPGVTLFSVGITIGPDGTVLVPTYNGHLFAYVPTLAKD